MRLDHIIQVICSNARTTGVVCKSWCRQREKDLKIGLIYRPIREDAGAAAAGKTELPRASLPGDQRALEPPDPIPNSEVKRRIADGSVGSPHVRVGHRQALIPNALISNGQGVLLGVA